MKMSGEHRRRSPRGRQSGVASIEFVLVFPVLLLLFFGLVNFAHYISASLKIAQAAVVAADVVSRATGSKVQAADFTDAFTAVELAVTPLPVAGVRVDFYDYFLATGSPAPVLRWRKSSPEGQACTAPNPSVYPIIDILNPSAQTPATDVIVAVVCMPYAAPVPNFPGLSDFFSNIVIRRSMALRPRNSATLVCTAC